MNVDVKPSPAGGTLLADPPAIARVGVIGAGQMGNGIAHVCALAGLDVTLLDVKAERAANARWHHRPQHGPAGEPLADHRRRQDRRRWRASTPAPTTPRSATPTW